MYKKVLEEIRTRHNARLDDGWITINGTHVMTDKEGNLAGKIGGKIHPMGIDYDFELKGVKY